MKRLLTEASLIMKPEGQSDGLLPSVKPIDGSGDFTFTRGSNLAATRINRAGLIEKGRENLLVQSNQFDTAWTNANTTETGGQSGYDGTNDAWLLSGSGQYPRIQQSVSSSGVNTISVYAKANTNNYLFINMLVNATGAYACFDLVNQTETLDLATKISSNIADIGNGWCRVSLAFSGTLGLVNFGMSNDGTVSGWINFTSGSIYIQDAQLEQGLAASPYIEATTTTAQAGVLENTPRLNYTTGVADPYLLLEPSRTNLISQSEYFGAWYNISQGTGSAPTLSIGGDFPLGDGKYYNLQCDLNGGNTSNDRSYISKTGLNATQFTAAKSIWIKNNSASEAVLFIGINFTADKFTLAPNADWQRITIEGGVINTEFRIGLGGGASQSNAIDVSIFGAQCEAGSYATSYIPTYSVSATRAADNCDKTNASDVIGQTEGTILVDVNLSVRDSYTYFALAPNLGSTSSYIGIGITATAFSFEVVSSGVQVAYNYSNSNTGNFKIAFAYKANDFVAYVNGTQAMTDTSGNVPACSQIALNHYDKDQPLLYKQATLFKERLSNAELATLTTI